jgi:hypothetical protein
VACIAGLKICYIPTLVVGDKDEFHRPFRGGEDRVGLVGLLMSGDKPHGPRRDLNESRHVVMAADCGRVSRDVFPDMEYQNH